MLAGWLERECTLTASEPRLKSASWFALTVMQKEPIGVGLTSPRSFDTLVE